MNILAYADVMAPTKVCPRCGAEIKAGGPGSGCNPEVGKCGRPPGSGNKPKGPYADVKWQRVAQSERIDTHGGKWKEFKTTVNGHDLRMVRRDDPNKPGKFLWHLYVDGQEAHNIRPLRKFQPRHQEKLNEKLVKIRHVIGEPANREEVQEKVQQGRERIQRENESVAPRRVSALSTMGVKSVRNLGGGVNVSKRLVMEDGSKAVFKPASGEKEWLRDAVGGPLYEREALAYDWARVVGIPEMPEVVTRKVGDEIGSIHRWAEGEVADDNLGWSNYANGRIEPKEYFESFDKDSVRDVAAFDYIASNGDRHVGNFLIGKKGSKNIVIPIDHGAAFHGRVARSKVLGLVRKAEFTIPRHTKQKWANKWDLLKDAAVERGIPEHQIRLLKTRYERFMGAVLWDDLKEDVY